jgi:hypothetical protein
MAAYHMLNRCDLQNWERDLRVVEFGSVFTLPLSFLMTRLQNEPERLSLQPPYREHLAQAFARFFMRIGLPQDIPSIR